MKSQDNKLRVIWHQKKIPVVFRQPKSKPLLIRIPYADNNRTWLKEKPQNKEPSWLKNYKCWQLPKSRFNSLIERMLHRFDKVYVIQPYQKQEKCAPACWNAKGFECECSCMGANHGSGNPIGNWFVVSETFAVNWAQREYACRLIEREIK